MQEKYFKFFFYLKRNLISIALFMITAAIIVLALLAYLHPPLGDALEQSTKWLSNITPLIMVLLACLAREQIQNWHYQKRSEAASVIIGKFSVCKKDLNYWVSARIMTPTSGENAAECKIHKCIETYIESCLEPSAQFPITIRKILEDHFKEMQRLANNISGAISINTSSGDFYGKTPHLNAAEDLRTLDAKLSEVQDFLDTTLRVYLQR